MGAAWLDRKLVTRATDLSNVIDFRNGVAEPATVPDSQPEPIDGTTQQDSLKDDKSESTPTQRPRVVRVPCDGMETSVYSLEGFEGGCCA